MLQIILLITITLLAPLAVKEYKYQKEFDNMLKPNMIIASEFSIKKNLLKREGYDSEGVYIFTNLSKNNYKYVGQSVDMMNRIDTHLRGRGNEDVYNDMRAGNQFTIEFVKLKDSTFSSLDMLEKYLITINNSYYNGYNKTRGNGN